MWYRSFLGPAEGPDRKPAVSATLLAGPLTVPLDQYAATYFAGAAPTPREEARGTLRGRSWEFSSADAKNRFALLLLEDAGRVVGLYCQGPVAAFEKHRPSLEEMARSLSPERLEAYPELTDAAFGFRLRVPPSWRETRRFSSRDTLLVLYTSPPLAEDRGRQTVHASLTLSVEPLPGDGGLEAYYEATRQKLGDAFKILRHEPWRGGYSDVMLTESALSESRLKRVFFAAGGRGMSLACEARDDVFQRVAPWCDVIVQGFAPAAAEAR